jgi:hypothetical protein
MASCLKNTWVESLRSLLMNVAGYEWRAVGVGHSWSIRRRSCCMKADGSTVGRMEQGLATDEFCCG